MTSTVQSDLPLDGLRVLDFSQFLAGPVCALRLGDLGAEVIKIERPDGGDAARSMAPADKWIGDDSLLFHTINRGKKSVVADLKSPASLASVKELIASCDVMIHNFRPGVMERIGLSYDDVNAINPAIIYGVVTGYGTDGPWQALPGQDLLIQARSGMAWLTGSQDDEPIPMGVSIVDIAAGMHLAQGILAALVRQARKNKGSLIEVSLLASAMDLQFEQFTSYLNSDVSMPQRSAISGANVHSAAPYGVYRTKDGHMVIAMAGIDQLHELLNIDALQPYADIQAAYSKRDQIKAILRDELVQQNTSHWMSLLEPSGIWCSQVLNWRELQATGALDALGVIQTVPRHDGGEFKTTTCPIRINGKTIHGSSAASALGADGQISDFIQTKKAALS